MNPVLTFLVCLYFGIVAASSIHAADKDAKKRRPLPAVVIDPNSAVNSRPILDPLGAVPGVAVVDRVSGYRVHDPGALAFIWFNQHGALRTEVHRTQIRPPSSDDGSEFPQCVTDPQFSPDARYVLFRLGTLNPGDYRMYVYDRHARRTYWVCHEDLEYFALSWSPDGKYIAFARGYNDPKEFDFGHNDYGRLQLCVCDWHTGKVTPVVKSYSLRGPWTWSPPHTLVYSALSSEDDAFIQKELSKPASLYGPERTVGWTRWKSRHGQIAVLPNIYTFSPETGRSRLLFKNGRFPVVSPDGERVAYFSTLPGNMPEPFGDWKGTTRGISLVTRNLSRLGAPVVVVSHVAGRYPDVLWEPGGKRLVRLDQYWDGPKTSLRATEWDLATRQSRPAGWIPATGDNGCRSSSDPVFNPLVFNADGSHLMIDIDNYLLRSGGGYDPVDTLTDLDLITGKILAVARAAQGVGIDWRYKTGG